MGKHKWGSIVSPDLLSLVTTSLILEY